MCWDYWGYSGSILTSSDIMVGPIWSPNNQPVRVLVPFPIPNDTRLLGQSFYQQALYYDYASGAFGVRRSFNLTRGGHGVVGR